MKFKIIMILIALVGVCAWFYFGLEKQKPIDPTLKALLNKIDDQGNMSDYFNEVGVNNSKDVGYEIKGEEICIIYGKCLFTINKKDLTGELLRDLKKLGITVDMQNEGEIVFKYHDEVIKQFE
ncbi:hypothetical protein [Vallitalea okinawensis]|uniref:hypothetical protein n=1 Tax=Vallitalea okinawensis TaxID=2078660 RepID=UPI000CFBBFE2|nr:hypothetical protein [Vallitalea okinawensis]